MSEQEKKRPRIYDLLNAETKPIFFVNSLQRKEKILQKKIFLKKKENGELNKNGKTAF